MNGIRQPDRSYELLWLSLGLLPLLLIALLLPLTPYDYWWYLRLGHDILQTGRVPTVDTYSFTYAGEPTINHPWLSAVILWLVYSTGGINLTFLLRAVCIGATYGLLWLWMRQLGAGPRLATLLITLAGLAGSNNWSIRPQMFAYPLFALTLLVLWKRHEEGGRLIWALPAIAVLWANLHDSFVLMFLLGGAKLLFGQRDRKPLFLVMVVSFLATLINPSGIGLWTSNISSALIPLSRYLSSEWWPPANLGWQMNIFFAWVLLFAPIVSFSKTRLSILEWAWLLGLLWMSVSGLRYVIWGLFMLATLSAHLLADWDAQWLDRPFGIVRPAYNYALAIIFLLVPLVALPGLRSSLRIKTAPVVSPDTPVAATDWLSGHPELPGPLWSDLTFSSYLIFALPSRPVWIDTRFERIYPVEHYYRYLYIANASPDWQVLLDHDGVNLLMISVNGEPYLLDAAQASTEWCTQYRDRTAAIYSRRVFGETCQ